MLKRHRTQLICSLYLKVRNTEYGASVLPKCYETWPEALNLERCSREDPAAAEIGSETRGLCKQKLERLRLKSVQTTGQGVSDSCCRMLSP